VKRKIPNRPVQHICDQNASRTVWCGNVGISNFALCNVDSSMHETWEMHTEF